MEDNLLALSGSATSTIDEAPDMINAEEIANRLPSKRYHIPTNSRVPVACMMKLLVKMLPLRLPTICIAHTLAGCDYLLCMLSVMRTALHIYFACAASCALLSVMRTAQRHAHCSASCALLSVMRTAQRHAHCSAQVTALHMYFALWD